jgi:hypothetical protein
MNSLICPHCQYENVVVTCGFCLQCGIDLDVSENGFAAPRAADKPTESSAQLLAQAVANQLQGTAVATDEAWAVRLPLKTGRHQVVHFSANPQDENMVSVFSLCGPVVERNALPLITWNGQLEDSFFAARNIDGKMMFVLTCRALLSGSNTDGAIAMAGKLGNLADSVEAKISAGADQH